jgi:hypothetical protein
MATSTQWRINVTANNGGAQLGVTDFQFRQTVGVPADFPSGTSFAADDAADFSHNANAAKDGDVFTGWRTTSGITASAWSATYSAAQGIVSFVIKGDADPTFSPKDFTFEYFNGTAWVVVDTRTAQTGWTAFQTREYTIGATGYDTHTGLFNEASEQWRLNITGNNGAAYIGILDWQLGSGNGLYGFMDSNYGGTSSALSVATGFPASYATDDNNSSTAWHSDGVTAATLTYTFPTGKVYEALTYYIRPESAAAMPSNFTLEYYDPTTLAWIVADTRTGQSGSADQTYTIARSTAAQAITNAPVVAGNNGNVSLGFFSVAGTASQTAVGVTINGDLSITSPDIAGSLEGPLALPPLDMAGFGVVGTVSDGAVPLLPPTLAGSLEPPPALALLTLTSIGYAGNVGFGDSQATSMDANGAMIAGTAADGAVLLPLLDVSALTDAAGAASLLPMTVGASGTAGLAGDATLLLEKITLNATATVDALPATGNAAITGLDASGVMLRGLVADGAAVLELMQAGGSAFASNIADGDAPLLPLDAIASGFAGAVAAGNLALVPMTLAGIATAPPPDNAGDGAITLPLAAMTSGAGIAGSVSDGAAFVQPVSLVAAGFAETLATGAADLAAITLAADMTSRSDTFSDGAAILAQPTVSAVSITGNLGAGAVALPIVTLSASGLTETISDGAAALSAMTASGALLFGGAPTTSDGDAALSPLQASGAGLTGTMSSGAATLAQVTASATAYSDTIAAGNLQFSVLSAVGTGFASAIATGAITLEPASVDAAGEPGNMGSAAITVPLMRVDAQGFADTVGTATISLPVLSMDASGIAGVLDPVFVGVALNTHTRAVSTYDGLGFNSLTEFNGMVLAATASGIVALTGDTDMGTPITAEVTGGVSDLGAPQFKRVLAGYVGYRAAGALDLTMITDEHHEYVYKLEPRRLDQIHASRVKFGRGVDGKYWQWKLANRDGADFALDNLSLDVQPLSRKIG